MLEGIGGGSEGGVEGRWGVGVGVSVVIGVIGRG